MFAPYTIRKTTIAASVGPGQVLVLLGAPNGGEGHWMWPMLDDTGATVNEEVKQLTAA